MGTGQAPRMGGTGQAPGIGTALLRGGGMDGIAFGAGWWFALGVAVSFRIPVLLLILLPAGGHVLSAGGIYWTNRGQSRVERAGFDGSGRTTVLAGAGSNVRGIALDLAGGRIFYADNGGDMIYRMSLDGSGREPILSVGPGAFPADLRLDLPNGHLYYCDRDRDHIRRCRLDGTDPVVVVPPGTQPYYLDLDIEGGNIYWGDFDGAVPDTGNVFRADLGGGNREVVVTGTLETRAVCLDKAGGMLYWVNRNAGRIQRAPLDALPVDAATSPAVETVYDGLDTPHGMVLDPAAGMLYWADTGTNGTGGLGAKAISRGRMDGSITQEVLVDLGSEPWDVDIDPRCLDYAEWVARYFPRGAGADAVPEADPDADGRVNVVEYATGSHPLRADPAAASESAFLHTAEGGATYPAFRFMRRAGTGDLSVLPQTSSTLAEWWDETTPGDADPRLIELAVEPASEGMERVTVRSVVAVDAVAAQQFRLRVELR